MSESKIVFISNIKDIIDFLDARQKIMGSYFSDNNSLYSSTSFTENNFDNMIDYCKKSIDFFIENNNKKDSIELGTKLISYILPIGKMNKGKSLQLLTDVLTLIKDYELTELLDDKDFYDMSNQFVEELMNDNNLSEAYDLCEKLASTYLSTNFTTSNYFLRLGRSINKDYYTMQKH